MRLEVPISFSQAIGPAFPCYSYERVASPPHKESVTFPEKLVPIITMLKDTNRRHNLGIMNLDIYC